MEDYLPEKNIQRAVGFMWHRYLIERRNQRAAHRKCKALLEAKVNRFVRDVHYKIVLRGREIIA